MLERTVQRARLLIPSERLVVIGTAHHRAHLFRSLGARPPGSVLLQPCNRDTGPGILLSLVHILRKDPDALVAVLPSDHFILPGRRFMRAVGQAATYLARTGSDSLVLLAVEPTYPETEYGWIELGRPVASREHEPIFGVKRFVEKPSQEIAGAMTAQGWLWNTMVIVARAASLMALVREALPELAERFTVVQRYVGDGREHEIVNEVYRSIPSVNFSTAILARRFERLAALPVQRVQWSDWGKKDRVLHSLENLGLPWATPLRSAGVNATVPQGMIPMSDGHRHEAATEKIC
jgi:mannose-1-phosphate guanylyltransferase